MNLVNSIVPVYKPKGPTSHDVIDKIRKITGIQKVGHAGTLDPLASGILVVGIGRPATKKLSTFVDKEKEYVADIHFGITSTTDDEQGDKTISYTGNPLPLSDIQKILPQFVGIIQQIPPVYSAVKIRGKPAHRRIRKGENVILSPRKREVKHITIKNYSWPYAKIHVTTGKGVYIRALARDIGKKLNVGAYLYDLVRIRVGGFSLDDALYIMP